ncbi:MAG: preprotein translocase subunit YajC [Alicyclobacillaceae bacterium]|jgi:preprotein translocase subunit YajC|uniref:preprotein translocase subunit YajC n=1 Tax=Alicyclobacillus sp. SP_1 TaxID=2942475 RepID=UPI0021576E6A|nr:preprotein translocase subunit YajC [Alicyclobacillus sp. SP_1]MCY0888337.1 preprotein translocase subunit YajC [Alicyclobacillaceae bacterium]MCY0895697.1 preprotein translocase subunit YajC [Alicyclobacillaceae bacterium]
MKPASLLILVVVIAVFYILMILPQRRQQKQRQAMMRSMEVGSKIVTVGGFHGQIVLVTDSIIRAEFAPGVIFEMDPRAIARVVSSPEPTYGAPETPSWEEREETADEQGTVASSGSTYTAESTEDTAEREESGRSGAH